MKGHFQDLYMSCPISTVALCFQFYYYPHFVMKKFLKCKGLARGTVLSKIQSDWWIHHLLFVPFPLLIEEDLLLCFKVLITLIRLTEKQWKELSLNTSEYLIVCLQKTEISEYKCIFMKEKNLTFAILNAWGEISFENWGKRHRS